MSKKCYVCGKKVMRGNSIARRGKAKKEGGVGKKTTGISKRNFLPNLQTKRTIEDGKKIKISVCAKCIKKGDISFVSR